MLNSGTSRRKAVAHSAESSTPFANQIAAASPSGQVAAFLVESARTVPGAKWLHATQAGVGPAGGFESRPIHLPC